MEFTTGCNQLGVEAYKGVVDFIMTDSWHDSENNFLLSYAEWDELVKYVEKYRRNEKLLAQYHFWKKEKEND